MCFEGKGKGSTDGTDVGWEKIFGFSNWMNNGGLYQEGEEHGGVAWDHEFSFGHVKFEMTPCGDVKQAVRCLSSQGMPWLETHLWVNGIQKATQAKGLESRGDHLGRMGVWRREGQPGQSFGAHQHH